MLLAEVKEHEQQKCENTRNDRGDSGAGYPQFRESKFAENHCVARGHIDYESEYVTDHDDMRTADAGEVGGDTGLCKSDNRTRHQYQVVPSAPVRPWFSD